MLENSLMPDASIKALLFDLGDVMIGLDFDRAYRAAAELSPYSPEEIRELVRQADLANPYERGEISSNVFYRRFCEAVEIDIPFDRFRLLWGDMFERKPLLPEDFFAALAENYRLVLLSNTNELHFEFIPRALSFANAFS